MKRKMEVRIKANRMVKEAVAKGLRENGIYVTYHQLTAYPETALFMRKLEDYLIETGVKLLRVTAKSFESQYLASALSIDVVFLEHDGEEDPMEATVAVLNKSKANPNDLIQDKDLMAKEQEAILDYIEANEFDLVYRRL